MKPITITIILFILFIPYLCPAQTSIRFTKRSDAAVTRTYSAKHKIKLKTPQGKWTQWEYCDSVSGTALFCGDTVYVLDRYASIKVRRPTTFSRVIPFVPFVAAASWTWIYLANRSYIPDEGIIPPLLFTAAGVPLSAYGVVRLFKKRPTYNLQEWSITVK